MKTVKSLLFITFSIFLTASFGLATSHVFKVKLSGHEVVPPVMTKASGESIFKLSIDGKEITYVLKVKGIENVAIAHIHAGEIGENGAPVVCLLMGPEKEGKFSGELAKGTITDKDLIGILAGKTLADLLKLIRDGGAYVNVHTDKNPPGEIRGQIR